MDSSAILTDAARRPLTAAGQVLAGLDLDTLHARPLDKGSSIAWLVWHAARQLDVQLADLAGTDQQWVTGGWGKRLGVPRGPAEIGFGDSDADVAALRVAGPDELLAYVGSAVEALESFVAELSDADLDVIVDMSYDPPVSRGVRLVSIIDDAVAHVAQAAYARGLLEGWRIGY